MLRMVWAWGSASCRSVLRCRVLSARVLICGLLLMMAMRLPRPMMPVWMSLAALKNCSRVWAMRMCWRSKACSSRASAWGLASCSVMSTTTGLRRAAAVSALMSSRRLSLSVLMCTSKAVLLVSAAMWSMICPVLTG